MSKEALIAFARALEADRQLAAELDGAVGTRTGDDAARSVAAFARERGFEVSNDDALEARREEGDLDDADLENVAGGTASNQFVEIWK